MHHLPFRQGFVSGGGRQGNQTEKKTEFRRLGPRQTDEVSADYGHHRPACARPHGETLEEPYQQRGASGQVIQRLTGIGRSEGMFFLSFSLDPIHQDRTGKQGAGDGTGKKKVALDQLVQKGPDKGGG